MRTKLIMTVILAFGFGLIVQAADRQNILISDFDAPYFKASNGKKDYYPGWKIEGDCWGSGPREATDTRHAKIRNISGQFAISSARHGDHQTGKITSAAFKIDRHYVNFLISGGNFKAETCFNLLINDKVVRSATGNNNDTLQPKSFDVKEFAGKVAKIQIVDNQRAMWGHITVDKVYMSDTSKGQIIHSGNELVKAVVQSTDKRFVGSLSIDKKVLKVNGQAIDLAKVLYMNFEGQSRDHLSPHAVRFKNGELWRVKILKLERKKLTIEHSRFGRHELDVEALSGLEFSTELSSGHDVKSLYIEDRETLPGKIMKIKDEEIIYNCPLGMLPLKRDTLIRYYFNDDYKNDQNVDSDQICLHDGTILRGKVSMDEKGITIEHKQLKAIVLPYRSVRFFLRHNNNLKWLSGFKQRVTAAFGPIGPAPEPKILDWRYINTEGRSIQNLNTVRIHPNSTVKYRLPTGDAKRLFRCVVKAADGSRAVLQLKLSVDNQEVWKGTVKASDEASIMSFKLPAGKDLIIEVSFADKIAFPCAIDISDAYLLNGNLIKN